MKKRTLTPEKSASKTGRNSRMFLGGRKDSELFFKPADQVKPELLPTNTKDQEALILEKMGHLFGVDFSDVRIHLNSDQTDKLDAQAFASGKDVHFAAGKFDPFSNAGSELIGHELTHILQQKNSENGSDTLAINSDSGTEKQATHFGKMAAKGQKITEPATKIPNKKATIQRKPNNENSSTSETVAAIADKTNAGGNILGGIMEKFNKQMIQAKQLAAEAMKDAQDASKLAQSKADKALYAMKNAGSGKSKMLSDLASKAAKEANEAKKIASLKQIKAANLLGIANKIENALPAVMKLLNRIPMNAIGFAASFTNKYLTTTNTTTTGKVADSGFSAGLDVAFGSAHPFVAAIDAIVGLIPGGERINISNTMGNSITSITGSVESIITGDISGIQQFYTDSKNGKNTRIFEKTFEAGDFWAEHGGADRAEMVGNYWGGADTVAGRATGFLGAMPGIGHAGEGLGWLAFQGYDKGGDALNYAGQKLSDLDEAIMPEGRTLNPATGIKSLLSGENPFW